MSRPVAASSPVTRETSASSTYSRGLAAVGRRSRTVTPDALVRRLVLQGLATDCEGDAVAYSDHGFGAYSIDAAPAPRGLPRTATLGAVTVLGIVGFVLHTGPIYGG